MKKLGFLVLFFLFPVVVLAAWPATRANTKPIPTFKPLPSLWITKAPTPSCIPRPGCLDSNPRCMIAEPVGRWCPKTPSPTPPPITCPNAKCVSETKLIDGKTRNVATCSVTPLSSIIVANQSVSYEGKCTMTPFSAGRPGVSFNLTPTLSSSPVFKEFVTTAGNYTCSFRACLTDFKGAQYCTPWGVGETPKPTAGAYVCPPKGMTINCMPTVGSKVSLQCSSDYINWVKANCDNPPQIVY